MNEFALACAGFSCAAVTLLLPDRGRRRLARLRRAALPSRIRREVSGGLTAVRGRLGRARIEEATASAVVELADALAAELVAGRPALSSLALACAGVEDRVLDHAVRPVVDMVRLGGDLAKALATASGNPGCRGLGWLAIAWRVAEGSGAGLATAVERIAATARAEGDHRREVRAQLAAPRATAALLAALPAVGIVLGVLLGADPLAILLGTPGGVACLVVGVALELIGLRWTARLAAAAERAA